MKKAAPLGQVEAFRAARNAVLGPAAIGAAAATIQALLEPGFVALHCALLVLVGALAGRVAARAAAQIRPQAAVIAGGTGGWMGGLAYGMPFAVAAAIRWLRFDANELARRIASMTQQEIANARAAGFDPTAMAFHTNQEVSYIFGYLIFGLGMGWLFGIVGAALARRSHNTSN